MFWKELTRMDELIRTRCLTVGAYMVSRQATVRQAARVFGLSKSSVHKDMISRLPQIDSDLSEQVAALLRYNKAVCHLRGGEATRMRYARERERRACASPPAGKRSGGLTHAVYHCPL